MYRPKGNLPSFLGGTKIVHPWLLGGAQEGLPSSIINGLSIYDENSPGFRCMGHTCTIILCIGNTYPINSWLLRMYGPLKE